MTLTSAEPLPFASSHPESKLKKQLTRVSLPIKDSSSLNCLLPIISKEGENGDFLSDMIRPIHLRGVHMVVIAYSSTIFILTELPPFRDTAESDEPKAPPDNNLILLKRIVFREQVQAVKWILGVESLILLVTFSNSLIFFSDDWKQLGLLDTPGESILSFDCGPAAPKDSFTLVLNSTRHSSIYRINALTGNSELKIQMDWNGQHLKLDDWLGLEASRSDGLYCYVDQEIDNWITTHK